MLIFFVLYPFSAVVIGMLAKFIVFLMSIKGSIICILQLPVYTSTVGFLLL